MKLNRTINELNRGARSNENENWNRLEKLSKEVDDLVLESGGDSNLEVIQARGGYPVLNNRLNDLDDQLSTKASKAFVEDGLSDLDEYKADKGALATIAQTKRDKDVDIEMKDLSQDVKEAMTGGSVAVVGEDAVDTVNLKNGAVARDKLDNNYSVNTPWLTGVEKDLNYVWSEGNYRVGSSATNNYFGNAGHLVINRFKQNAHSVEMDIKQTLTSAIGGKLKSVYRILKVNETDMEIISNSDWQTLGDDLDDYMTSENESWAI